MKEFLPYETVRNDALKLASKIYHSGFIPESFILHFEAVLIWQMSSVNILSLL